MEAIKTNQSYVIKQRNIDLLRIRKQLLSFLIDVVNYDILDYLEPIIDDKGNNSLDSNGNILYRYKSLDQLTKSQSKIITKVSNNNNQIQLTFFCKDKALGLIGKLISWR